MTLQGQITKIWHSRPWCSIQLKITSVWKQASRSTALRLNDFAEMLKTTHSKDGKLGGGTVSPPVLLVFYSFGFRGACTSQGREAKLPLRAHPYICMFPHKGIVWSKSSLLERQCSIHWCHSYTMLLSGSEGLSQKTSWPKLSTARENAHSKDRRDGRNSIWSELSSPCLPLKGHSKQGRRARGEEGQLPLRPLLPPQRRRPYSFWLFYTF